MSTMQPLTQSGAASEKGYALKLAEERKMAAHNAECRGAGVSFVPLAVELLGGWSHEAALQISRIGRLVGQRLGTTPAEAVHICSSGCPSSMWAHCLPSHSAWTMGTFTFFFFFCLFFCFCFFLFVFCFVLYIYNYIYKK